MPEPAQRKTISFSFDGTGNEPSDVAGFTKDESISNVLKMHVLMGRSSEGGRSDTTTPSGDPQCTFYYSGRGTSHKARRVTPMKRSFHKARRAFNMIWAPAWGDADRILAEARRDLSDTYQKGDRVLVFGFSRGAALARKFICEVPTAEEREEFAFSAKRKTTHLEERSVRLLSMLRAAQAFLEVLDRSPGKVGPTTASPAPRSTHLERRVRRTCI